MSEGWCLGNVSQKAKCSNFSSWIKNKIENEGVQARNIIKYSLPVNNLCSPRRYVSKCDFSLSSEIDHEITNAKNNKITIPDDVNDNRSSVFSEVNSCSSSYDRSILGEDNLHKGRTVSDPRSSSSMPASSRTMCSQPHHRFGSAATVPYMQVNRGRPLTESEYKARYWGQMLDTLRRTIDEIYSACETDENEVECKEVIMILEHSKQDFFSLIEKMNLLRDYEQTDEQNRPNSLAWDERTILPGKPIMCQVLASTGVVTSAHQSYISLPLNIKSDSSVTEVPDSDSDIGRCRSGSRSYSVDKRQLNTANDANDHHRHDDESCTIPPTNPNLCNFDNEPSDANDCEYEDEVEVVEDEEEEEEHHHHQRQNMPTSFTYLVDDDTDYIDQEDNTLSHDLEKLDKAIANVTTVERVLSHQLDRAQLAEASLRRRLIKEEKAAFVLSAGYNNQLWYGSRLKNTINESQHSEDVDTCGIVTASDDVEIDTDIDLLDMDSIIMDVDGSEKLLSENMKKITKCSNEQQHQQLKKIICSPLNFIQKSSQHRSNVDSNRIESNNKIIDNSGGNYFYYGCCNCRCHRHNYTFNHHLSPIDFQCYKIDSQDKHLVSVQRTHLQDSSNSVYMSKIENDVCQAKCPLEQLTPEDPTSKRCDHFTESSPPETKRSDISDSFSQTNQISTNGTMLERPRNLNSCETISLSASGTQGTLRTLPLITSDVGTCPQGLLLIPKTEAKSRIPGHGVHMHEKLSARSKRRSANSIQEIEEKQARARVLRQQHLLERTERVHELSKKVDEVHLQKRMLLHQRRSCLERRLHAAERKRQAELTRRVLKAHDEETKGKEIAFIQTLEAEQKQHSILTKHEESRARLNELAIERQRRNEEKLGREEAVKIRRRALEASRLARLDALQARWKIRAQQLASRAKLLEHSRRAAARAKEQSREIKMATLEEQQRTHIEQLRFKIQRKQEESERRHQESLREISRKAFEMSVLTHTRDDSLTVPGIEPYPVKKWCRACQVMIVSEVQLKSHLHGKRHQNAIMEAAQNRPVGRSELEAFNLSHLVDAPNDVPNSPHDTQQERLKLRRKRARKLRQRMNQRGLQFLKEVESYKAPIPDSPNKPHLIKLIKDARRFLNLPDSGPWVITRVQAMEKCLNALLRCISNNQSEINEKQCQSSMNSSDRHVCLANGLLSILVNLIGLIREQKPFSKQLVPEKIYKTACHLLQILCSSNTAAHIHMLLSNNVSILVDCLVVRFSTSLSYYHHQTLKKLVSNITDQNSSTTLIEQIDQGSSFFHSLSNDSCTLNLLNCLSSLLNGFYELNYFSKLNCVSGGGAGNASVSGSAVATPSSSSLTSITTATTFDDYWNGHAKIDCQRIQNLLSYIVSSGLVDLLSARLSNPKQASWLLINNNNDNMGHSNYISKQFVEYCQQFVLSSIAFLTSLTRLLDVVSISKQINEQQTNSEFTTSNSSSVSKSFIIVDSVEDLGEDHSECSVNIKSIKRNTSSPTTPVSLNSTCDIRNKLNSNIIFNDPTQLLETINSTEVFGLVPLLYCLLLDPKNSRSIDATTAITNVNVNDTRPTTMNCINPSSDCSDKIDHCRKSLHRKISSINSKSSLSSSRNYNFSCHEFQLPFCSEIIAQITLNTLKLINSLAVIHRNIMQSILGSELICLLIRHILINLLARCVPQSNNYPEVITDRTIISPLPSRHRQQQQQQEIRSKSKTANYTVVDNHRHHSSDSNYADADDDDTETNLLLPSGARKVVVKSKRQQLKSIHNNYQIVECKNPPLSRNKDSISSFIVQSENIKHSNKSTYEITDLILHEVILCIGYLCVLNVDNQTSLQCGPSPNILQRLLSLPFEYFSHRPLTDILYPTLIACCYRHPSNMNILESELNSSILANYIEERLLERKMDSLVKIDKKYGNCELLDERFNFDQRFNISEWNSAKIYFTR
ncbi:hypothetical protein MN116_008766 [Schistosoma mekongi]|uniref:S phase cyclin A-associated protein in the endoplasmic reticulum n=1 Tax=Schistosoma mekongi TaxID=38744 RepID=A0AAE2D2B1_SCHME|nr:hypothetical protein MN116_008766 [Schistosoma mekongi]